MGIPGNAKTRRVFFCIPNGSNVKCPRLQKEQRIESNMSTGKCNSRNSSPTQISEEECENFLDVLIPVTTCDFTVILHKDDTHKSIQTPWQFHSGLDKLSTKLRPFYGSKEPQLHCTCFLRISKKMPKTE